MNESLRPRAWWPLALAITCAVLGSGWAVVRTPLGPGEAALLEASGAGAIEARCAPAPGRGVLELAACALPGGATLVGRLAAAAARLGGPSLARALCALAAPALVLLAWWFGRSPRQGRRALVTAATFIALGTPLQLVATVHPRVLAAVLVALAAVLLEPPADRDPALAPGGRIRAALAGAALALAVTATPVAALLVPPLALAARPGARAGPLVAALAAGLALSATAGHASWAGLVEALRACPAGEWEAVPPRLARAADGVAMPLLLAAFALFHRDGGRRAAAALAVAAPLAGVALVSARLEDLRTAQLLAFVVLTPAAALGIAQLSEVCASGNPSRRARPLFAAAALVVAGVYGVHEMRMVRRDGVVPSGRGAPAPSAVTEAAR